MIFKYSLESCRLELLEMKMVNVPRVRLSVGKISTWVQQPCTIYSLRQLSVVTDATRACSLESTTFNQFVGIIIPQNLCYKGM